MKFNEDDIRKIYSGARTGADFPRLAHDLRNFGVVSYVFFVETGINIYYDDSGDELKMTPKYPHLSISKIPHLDKLQEALRIHQQGKTDFPTFCNDVAQAGVNNWKTDLVGMTVAYYSIDGNMMLMENIPQIN